MYRYCLAVVLRLTACFLVAGSATSSNGLARPQGSADEQAIWNLEHAYWRYAQENDLDGYVALWHKDFLGWPDVYAAPTRKDHVADWITTASTKGFTFKFTDLKAAGIQITGNIAVVCYWITANVLDKDGKTLFNRTSRITHTWLKNGNDWQIISGMSMPEPATATK